MSKKENEYEKVMEIQNKLGLHARPAAMLVSCSNKFQADVFITKGDETVNGKSIMGVMMLAASHGAKLHIKAIGEDSEDAVKAIEEVINNKFNEE